MTLRQFENYIRYLVGLEHKAIHAFPVIPSILDGLEEIFDHEEAAKGLVIPMTIDNRSKCPPVWDQGDEGSCTAHAGAAHRMLLVPPGSADIDLSRAFQYFCERKIERDTDQDGGAQMKTIVVSLKKYGICPTSDMPYISGQYTTAPTAIAYKDAEFFKIDSFIKVDMSVKAIQTALAAGNPSVLCGINVYQSMESATVQRTGVLPMPRAREQIIGGHAVLIVGYVPVDLATVMGVKSHTSSKGYFIVRNSWGPDWGMNGYFLMPYEYIGEDYANEFWVGSVKKAA